MDDGREAQAGHHHMIQGMEARFPCYMFFDLPTPAGEKDIICAKGLHPRTNPDRARTWPS